MQVGEYDLVVAMGTKLLEKWESRIFRRDILLSMTLAQCGLATDTFAVQQVVHLSRPEHHLKTADGSLLSQHDWLSDFTVSSMHVATAEAVLNRVQAWLAINRGRNAQQGLFLAFEIYWHVSPVLL